MTVIGWVATLPGWPLYAVGASSTPTTVLTPGVLTPRPGGAHELERVPQLYRADHDRNRAAAHRERDHRGGSPLLVVGARARARELALISARVLDLVEAGDLNELLRAVDGFCAARSWDELLDLAERCEEAVERGKQLWPIAEHIDYRIALEAPGDYAGGVLHPGIGRFSLGPLTEVAASTHTWSELAPHIETPQAAAYVAQERVLRGEMLETDSRAHPEILELPLRLWDWEPAYALATYGSNFVEVDEPGAGSGTLRPAEAGEAPRIDDPELVDGLIDIVRPWVAESGGAADAIVVEGTAAEAAAGCSPTLLVAPLEPAAALRRVAWAASSGGTHGARRGGAYGRFAAWYLTALMVGLEWPADPAELGSSLERLRWIELEEPDAEPGWALRLAVEDPDEGWAAALSAHDPTEVPPEEGTRSS
jgi:hypothetical protein